MDPLWTYGEEAFQFSTAQVIVQVISHFYLESENICFLGDVIFSGSVGRTDLPGGDFVDLKNSILNKIYTLPDHTELAVGHGPNTTVGQEKESNPYVRP